MSKSSSVFVCQQCGNEYSKWMGKCNACGEWNSLVETVRLTKNSKQIQNSKTEIQKLTDIKASETKRISTNISELDRVLGGGLVKGQVVLIAGEPGVGKSTMLLQLSDNLKNVIYISGEESATQIAIRAKRLGIINNNIKLIESTDVDEVVSLITNHQPQTTCVIVDSIQTISTSDLTGLAGSVGQVRECAFRLLRYAKETGIPVIIVGHVTKEGTVAGPSVLAHIVDTVLWFEGEKISNLRLLRSKKNRFGTTDEVGIFSMEETGLKSLENAEKIFLDDNGLRSTSGSAISILLEGTRSILVEIQSLVVPSKLAFPKRVAQGIDSKRLEMLLAVLIRRCGLKLYEMDVFVSVAGGIKTKDPGLDLAICLSIASAYYDKPLSKKLISVGEVGLLGEIRKVNLEEKRIKDGKRLGFSQTVSPKDSKSLNEVVKTHLANYRLKLK